MPLVTSAQFPGQVMNAAPLANRLSEIMADRRAKQEEQATAEAQRLAEAAKGRASQFLHLRGLSDGANSQPERMAAFHTQKRELAKLATRMAQNNEDLSLVDEAMKITDPTELNTFFSGVAAKYLDPAERLEKELTKGGGTKVLGEGAQLVDDTTGELIAENESSAEDKPREMKQDANGRWRYTDTKELVFSEVEKDPEERDPEKTFSQTKKLRDEFTKATDEFAKINNSYTRVISSAEDPSPAGDMALIFNYMKILDPGSAVREAEFRTAGQAGNLPTQVQQAYNKLAEGQLLTKSMRKDFVNRAGRLYKGLEKNHKKREKEYIRIADSFDLDPSQVIVEQSVSDIPVEEAGPIGDVEEEKTVNGKRYQKIGGKWYGVE